MDGAGLTAIRARVYVVEVALCIFREMTSGRDLAVLFLIVNTIKKLAVGFVILMDFYFVNEAFSHW